MHKSTKIVATIGPATDKKEMIQSLYNSGMNVARLNFSHGNHEYFEEVIKRIRSVSDKIAILLDTKGPEIRTGMTKDDRPIFLAEGNELILKNDKSIVDEKTLVISYKKIDQLKKGNVLAIDDGLIETEVIKKTKDQILLRVLNSGVLGSRKTVSIQGHNVEIPFLSKKDKEDIKFGIEHGVDFIAASFVREANEVEELKKIIKKANKIIRVISKIEHPRAIENVDEIIDVSHGIMVARGDLGVEMPLSQLPRLQKKIIHRCNELGRPVIVATQMLESMKSNPRPTRAEVADVAQAIMDGADAVMLSGETANGKYPVEAVKMMANVAKEYDLLVRKNISDLFHCEEEMKNNGITIFITSAAAQAAKRVNAKAILTPTESGYTPRKVSRFKPRCPIYAMTPDPVVARQLQLSWGVQPILIPERQATLKQMQKALMNVCFENGFIKENDKVVMAYGNSLYKKGSTNNLKVFYAEDPKKK